MSERFEPRTGGEHDGPAPADLGQALDVVIGEAAFSGAVRIDLDGETVLRRAYGSADRGHRIPATIDTRFGIASGTKGLTALTVATLLDEGALALTTSARSVLGRDLPLVDDDVTV